MDELVARFKAGDETVFDEIVTRHIPLVKHLARRWMAQYPTKYEDIYASALLGLTQAVRWAPTRLNDLNIGAYITVTVTRFIRDFLQKDYIIPVPRREYVKRMKADENPVPIVFSKTFEDLDALAYLAYEKPKQEEQSRLDEIIIKLDLNEYHKQILNLRMQGYTLREIGDYFNVSYVTISNEIQKIKANYARCYSKAG